MTEEVKKVQEIKKCNIKESNGYYEKKKRKNKVDNCNICGNVLPLTWDHVPPKFCFNDGTVKYNSMMGFITKNIKRQSVKME